MEARLAAAAWLLTKGSYVVSVKFCLIAAHVSHEGRCATGMPASENETGNLDVAAALQEALKKRLGEALYGWWIAQGLQIQITGEGILVSAGPFMVDRVRRGLIHPIQQAIEEINVQELPLVIRARQTWVSPQEESSEDGLKSQTIETSEVQVIGTRATEVVGDDGSARANPKQAGVHVSNRQSAANREKRDGSAKASKDEKSASSKLGQALSAKQASVVDLTDRDDSGKGFLSLSSLENFCVGECNNLAQVAAKMVVDQPGSPSPLFFWGPAGVGKTHLLAAIRNELRTRHRLRRVLMMTAEQFTNDFTSSLRDGGIPLFRRRYRDVDALLIDDVQFMVGKRATMRELAIGVESLIRGRRQIAVTGDRPPLEIEGLCEELAVRLAGGMTCPMKQLDRETRLHVLQNWTELHQLEVSSGILERLADELVGDGRILSGAFNHLRVLGQMLDRPATWDELAASAPDLISAGRPVVNLRDIQKAVCDLFSLPAGSLSSRGQHRSVSQPRMLAMYLARQYTRAAYSEIGEFFGDRSHSTVIAATKRVEDWISSNKPLRRGSQSLAPKQAIENLLRTG